MDIAKTINIMYLLTQKQIELNENLQGTKLYKQEFKNISNRYLKVLEKVSDDITNLAKELDKENYENELNKMHEYYKELDDFLDENYKKFEK